MLRHRLSGPRPGRPSTRAVTPQPAEAASRATEFAGIAGHCESATELAEWLQIPGAGRQTACRRIVEALARDHGASSKCATASSSHATPVPGASGTAAWPSRIFTGARSMGPARSRCSKEVCGRRSREQVCADLGVEVRGDRQPGGSGDRGGSEPGRDAADPGDVGHHEVRGAGRDAPRRLAWTPPALAGLDRRVGLARQPSHPVDLVGVDRLLDPCQLLSAEPAEPDQGVAEREALVVVAHERRSPADDRSQGGQELEIRGQVAGAELDLEGQVAVRKFLGRLDRRLA